MIASDAVHIVTKAPCRHLPDDVRVFSAQRVNNRFNGRDMCTSRTYHFYVPAAALKLLGDGGTADAETLERLQRTLDVFVADRPYHNYTQRCASNTQALSGTAARNANILWACCLAMDVFQ